MVRYVAVLLAAVLLFGCAHTKPCEPTVVYREVQVPVPVAPPAPPDIAAPDLWMLKMEAEKLALLSHEQLLVIIIHDIGELVRVAREQHEALEVYRELAHPQ